LIAEHPDLKVLINNAGIMQPDAAAGKIDDALMVATITTNLMGPIRMTSALIELRGVCKIRDSWPKPMALI
jgi:uncharacterized oxidoreductase